jgi:predicted AlkP superfamily phosphohydrolase/phosphomutase
MIGVPQTYPPSKVNGYMVSCFLTPSIESEYTYPPGLKQEIKQVVGEYLFDVPNFRTDNKGPMLDSIFDMTEKRFQLVKHLLKNQPTDFAMVVEIGCDRLHHGFWKYYDKGHRRYEANTPFQFAVRDYYRLIDQKIGEVLELIDQNTLVLIVSDHGVKKMDGGICINEWLKREGYLVLDEEPTGLVTLNQAKVNWKKTKAWGWGGYYARIFLNVKGRDPEGIIEPADYEKEIRILTDKLKGIPDDTGKPLDHKIWRPHEMYKQPTGELSDLMAFFGDLSWRAIGTLGHNAIHIFENDTGPDDAVHDWDGMFMIYDPAQNLGGINRNLHVLDIAPTVLQAMGLKIPADMTGNALKI